MGETGAVPQLKIRISLVPVGSWESWTSIISGNPAGVYSLVMVQRERSAFLKRVDGSSGLGLQPPVNPTTAQKAANRTKPAITTSIQSCFFITPSGLHFGPLPSRDR